MPPCTGFMMIKEKKDIYYLYPIILNQLIWSLTICKGNTDECLICEIKFDEDKKTTIKNKVLKDAIENKSPDDNPILCLIKANNNETSTPNLIIIFIFFMQEK